MHAKPGGRSALEYSRDALAGPLERLKAVLVSVREGRFVPDATRSGRWVRSGPSSAAASAQEGNKKAAPAETSGVAASSPLVA